MFDKFEDLLNRTLVPIAQKMDKQPHLSAIKSAMVALIPFTILGSIFTILPAIANMLGEGNVVSDFINSNAELWKMAVTLSIDMMSIYVIVGISNSLGKHYNLYTPACIGLSIFAFLFISLNSTENGIEITYLGAKGLFCAMIAAIIATEIYHFCIKKRITVRMPDGVPDFVGRSFEVIPIILIISVVFLAIRLISFAIFGTLPPEILAIAFKPLVVSMDNIFVVWFMMFLSCLLFFFGIHPSVLNTVIGPIAATYIAENISAKAAGTALPHFFTLGTKSAFFGFSGTGVTIGLVLLFLFSKSKTYKKLGRVAIFPSLFGINEPVIFGMPVMLNPMMLIPFVIGGSIIGTLPLFLIQIGFLDKPFFDPPYVGVFLEGFLTNLDFKDIFVQMLQVVLSLAVYFPFFKLCEKQQIKQEQKFSNKSNYKFTKLEQALLGDLDF